MSNGYNWEEILSKFSDKELLEIYHNKVYPIQEKREAARKILIQRGILNPQTKEIVKVEKKDKIPYAKISLRFWNYVIDILIFYVIAVLLLLLYNIRLSFWTNFLIVFLYYLILEGLFARTIGKLITGTKVIDEQGNKPSFDKIFIRTLARFIPFEPLSFLGSKKYGWHDSLSKTFVVKKDSEIILEKQQQISNE